MKFLRTFVCWVMGAAWCVASGAASAEVVNLSMQEKSPLVAIAGQVLTEVYKKAGLELKLQTYPAARASAVALSGEVDGEVSRGLDYIAKNPTLIKVEPAYFYGQYQAVAKADKGIKITSRDDLKKYKIAVVRGNTIYEKLTEGISGVQMVNTTEQLYQMLEGDRIDVILDNTLSTPVQLKAIGSKNIKPVGDLGKIELFTLLHPSKKDLAPKIGAAIKALKDSGELDKLIKKQEDAYLKTALGS
jgi:ABC-type amino acid transport substrate-binding protein